MLKGEKEVKGEPCEQMGKEHPQKEVITSRDHEKGASLTCIRNSKETSVGGAKGSKKRSNGLMKLTGDQIV